MPAGSGTAINAAGACRIGVRSAQLAAMNSIGATPISPLTKKTTISASARQARSTRTRDEVEEQADLRMVAPPIRHGAADERKGRQHQPGGFVHHRKEWRKKRRAMTLASTRRSSPSSAPMTIVSARRSTARKASGSRVTPSTAASAFVIALGRAKSPLGDTWPYHAELFAARYGADLTATLLTLRMAFLPGRPS